MKYENVADNLHGNLKHGKRTQNKSTAEKVCHDECEFGQCHTMKTMCVAASRITLELFPDA